MCLRMEGKGDESLTLHHFIVRRRSPRSGGFSGRGESGYWEGRRPIPLDSFLSDRGSPVSEDNRMDISVERVGTVIVVSVNGTVDLASAPSLRTELEQRLTHASPKLVIDLSGVDYIDSYGLGVLVEAMKRARHAEGEVRLCAPRAEVRTVLDVTGLSGRILVLPSRRDALVSFARDSAPPGASS